jgi:hypothetical protein
MMTLYTLEEIQEADNLSVTFRAELERYFRDIAEGIAGDGWKSYSLSEVGPILVIEEEDTAEVLDEYGLMQGSKTIPASLPEFAVRVNVGGVEMLRIIWVCTDYFGLSVYYPAGQFGKEFDEFIMQYAVD